MRVLILFLYIILAAMARAHLIKRANEKVPDLNFSPPLSPKESVDHEISNQKGTEAHQTLHVAYNQDLLTLVSFIIPSYRIIKLSF